MKNLRKIVRPHCLAHDAYYDFIYKFVKPINIIELAKRIRLKTNSEPWFDNDVISAIQRRNKLFKKFKLSGSKNSKNRKRNLTLKNR